MPFTLLYQVTCVALAGQSRCVGRPSVSMLHVAAVTQMIVSVCLECINEFIADCKVPIHKVQQSDWVTSPRTALGVALLVGVAAEIIADTAELTMALFKPFMMQVNDHTVIYTLHKYY